jgi:hypothetical protein
MLTVLDEAVSLWDSLHDGSLESLSSDALDRSMTVVVDVPYLWSFHSLPDTARFRLILEGVSEVEALRFVAWPGDLVIPEGSSWEDSEAIRARYFEKGRLESVEWQDVAGRLLKTDEYEISQATITIRGHNATMLTLQLSNYDRNDYPKIRITAERVRFFLGSERELSRPEFLNLGEAYWRAFAERRPKLL